MRAFATVENLDPKEGKARAGGGEERPIPYHVKPREAGQHQKKMSEEAAGLGTLSQGGRSKRGGQAHPARGILRGSREKKDQKLGENVHVAGR